MDFEAQEEIYKKIISYKYITYSEISNFIGSLGNKCYSDRFLLFMQNQCDDIMIYENINLFYHIFSSDYFNDYLFNTMNEKVFSELDSNLKSVLKNFSRIQTKKLKKNKKLNIKTKKAKKEKRGFHETFSDSDDDFYKFSLESAENNLCDEFEQMKL